MIRFWFGLGLLYTTYHADHRLPPGCWHSDGEWTFAWGPWRAFYTTPGALRKLAR